MMVRLMRAAPATLALVAALAACAGDGDEAPAAPIASAGATQATPEAAAVQADQAVDQQVRTLLNPPSNTGRFYKIIEVEVDLLTPGSQRAVVPYLLKPEVWTLIKVDLSSPTQRIYRFQRLTDAAGNEIPDIDPLILPRR
jgi:hypothetical protein